MSLFSVVLASLALVSAAYAAGREHAIHARFKF
jgi:hypothetical protein